MKFTATLLVMMRPAVSVDTEHSDQHVTTRRNVVPGTVEFTAFRVYISASPAEALSVGVGD
jgi:hypothetical protein